MGVNLGGKLGVNLGDNPYNFGYNHLVYIACWLYCSLILWPINTAVSV